MLYYDPQLQLTAGIILLLIVMFVLLQWYWNPSDHCHSADVSDVTMPQTSATISVQVGVRQTTD